MNHNIDAEKFIHDLLYSSKCSAHLKDVESGKYLASNDINVLKFGLKKGKDIEGLTIEDLDSSMRTNWGKNLLYEIVEIERKVVKEGVVYNDERSFLTKEGRVFVHYMTKIPIFNKNGKVVNIYTKSEDITNSIKLLDLLDLYIYNYFKEGNKIAIVYFLKHFDLVEDFYIFPTKSELKVMLAKTTNPTNKHVAKFLQISPRTVETHMDNLRNKIKIPIEDALHKIYEISFK